MTILIIPHLKDKDMDNLEYIAICFKYNGDPYPRRYHIRGSKINSFNGFLAREGYIYWNRYNKASGAFIDRIWVDLM